MSYTVLCIEDNEANMLVIERISEHGLFKLLKAVSVTEGLAQAREHLPDIILLDYQLPDIDGITAVGMMKADEKIAHIPVIMVTASSITLQECLAAGCVDRVLKPITMDKLLVTLHKHKL